MKLIWCSWFPEIYAQLEEGWGQSAMSICAFCYIWNLFGAVVFQRSMLDWRRGGVSLSWVYMHSAVYETYLVQWFPEIYAWLEEGVGSVCQGYMCILLYMKLIWCSGFPGIYAQLEEGVGSVCHGYMYILLYVKPLQCNCFPEIYAKLGGTLPFGICAFFYMWNFVGVAVFQRSMLDWRRGYVCLQYMCILLYVKVIWCSGFPEIYAQLEEGWGQSAMNICAFCYIWNLFGAVVFQRSMLDWRSGGVSLSWVYMYSAVYETYLVQWFPEIYAWLEEGVGSVCHGYMCILLYMKLIWCSGFPGIYAQLEEGVGSVCHGYMYILLYVKPLQCNCFPEIYAKLGGTPPFGICAFFYMWNFFGVAVFQRSMLDWRRGYVCLQYMCILLYVKVIWCSGFPEIYAQLEEGVHLHWVCLYFSIGYMFFV